MVLEVIDMLVTYVYVFTFTENRLTNQPPVMNCFSSKDNQTSVISNLFF